MAILIQYQQLREKKGGTRSCKGSRNISMTITMNDHKTLLSPWWWEFKKLFVG